MKASVNGLIFESASMSTSQVPPLLYFIYSISFNIKILNIKIAFCIFLLLNPAPSTEPGKIAVDLTSEN